MSDQTNDSRRPFDDELLRHPDRSSITPPVSPLVAHLPFEQQGWKAFEQLCVALARATYPAGQAGLYGAQGDEQQGIDFWVDEGEELIVGQCRNVGEMGPKAMRKAVEDFLDGEFGARASSFILATRQSFELVQRAKELRRLTQELGERNVTLIRWDLDGLSDALRTRPDIVERFFGPAWVQRFCLSQPPTPTPPLRRLPPPGQLIGREADVAWLGDMLEDGVPRAVALVGLPGVGKSELAVHFAHQVADRYGLAALLEAADRDGLVSGLAGLGKRLGLQASGDPESDAVAVRDHLLGRDDWLVVVDGLRTAADLQGLVPLNTGGHLIVTSQQQAGWNGLAMRARPLGGLGDQDACDLVLLRAGSQDRVSAGRISEVLGGLPLAVAQAGAFADATGTSLAEVADMLEASLARVLGRPVGHPERATIELWHAAFEAVEVDEAAAVLLHAIAFMAERGVSAALQRAALQAASHAPSDAPGARERLMAFSLIARATDEEDFSMHRLVATALRERGGVHSEAVLAFALSALDEQLRTELDGLPLEAWEGLVEHARSVTGVALQRTVTGILLARVLMGLASLSLQLGRAQPALADLEAAFQAVSAEDHSADLLRIWMMNNYAVALLRDGQVEEARNALRQVLALKQQAFEVGHPETVSTLTSLSDAERRLGHLEPALVAVADALLIIEGGELGDARAHALALGARAAVHLDARRPEQARDDLLEAGRVLEPLGEAGISAAMGVEAELAGAELALGHAHRAVTINRKTLAYYSEHLPPDHPHVLNAHGNLASALMQANELDPAEFDDGALTEAEALLDAAIEARMRRRDFVGAARDTATLGLVLVQDGREDRGRALQLQAISTLEQRLEPDHHDLAVIRENLALSTRGS